MPPKNTTQGETRATHEKTRTSVFKVHNGLRPMRMEVVINTPPGFKRKQPPELVKGSQDTKAPSDALPKKFKRKRVVKAVTSDDEAPPRKKRARTSLESKSKDEAPVRRKRRLMKSRQSHSSDESCSGDEVDSEHIVPSRLRTRGKLTPKDKIIENMRRKKQGLPPLAESETSDDSDNGSASSWDSLFDVESDDDSVHSSNFIVEDDGSAAALLPAEFSMVAHEGLSEQFKKIFQFMVHLAVRPPVEREGFMKKMLKEEEYFSIPFNAARRRISSIRDTLASQRWKPAFTDLLTKYPELKIEDVPSALAALVCDVCQYKGQGRRGCKSGKLSGIPYNRTGFRDIDDEFWGDDSTKKGRKKDSKDPKEYNVGRFCAERTQVFHKISHWEYELFKSISHEVDQLHEKKSSSGVFNDRDIYVPIKKLDVKDVNNADEIFEWLEKRHKVEMEWKKLKALFDQAENVENATKRGKTD
ncbi:hypothetical protein MVEN_02051400 [Mycena venus]|uniref:DUF4211 domain-containing protein n=1 Tax=Mycena venus TaxID=2733690 RepID=A0A8H7CJ80_9AGAR|nr:hypothetical protein MVEN_02051400 [Mycena venus]